MNKTNKPTLVLFCGLPGSGKTTLAKKLEAEGRGIRICTDDWREALGIPHSTEGFHSKLQALLYDHALKLLKSGQDVILEDGLWTKKERDTKLQDVSELDAIIEMNFFDLSFEENWRRLELRNSQIDDQAAKIDKDYLVKCWDIFEKISEEESSAYHRLNVYGDDDES